MALWTWCRRLIRHLHRLDQYSTRHIWRTHTSPTNHGSSRATLTPLLGCCRQARILRTCTISPSTLPSMLTCTDIFLFLTQFIVRLQSGLPVGYLHAQCIVAVGCSDNCHVLVNGRPLHGRAARADPHESCSTSEPLSRRKLLCASDFR